MRAASYPRRPPTLQLGLRLQIVLALAGLMLLAFVPLFFAVASLTRATVVDAREHAARALAQMMAAHAARSLAEGGEVEAGRVLAQDVEAGGVESACVFSGDGARIACRVGPERSAGGRAVEVSARKGDVRVDLRARLGEATDRGTSLVRLVALYMTTFGLALSVFAYLVLTRLIVRPVEELVGAADRVASGARTLRVPRSGARELVELGASVQEMAEKLIHEEASLRAKVEELTQTTTRLTETQSQLVRSERMASVGRLAAGLAHEIGNPLAALMGMEELLLDGQLPPEAQRDFLERIRRETERIHTIVRDLLDFARPEESRPAESVGAASTDVGVVVDDVMGLARPQKPFRSIHLEAEIPVPLQVALSASRLTQVLLNIVLNAGAAIASAHRANGRVVIRAVRTGSRVRIEVEDNGPGIAPSIRDRLFEPFVTTKDVGEGTGLGLAVCRGLVESAGGEIGVDAAHAAGARFYVVLPLSS